MEANPRSGSLSSDLMSNWSDGLCRERRPMKTESKTLGAWTKVISGLCLHVRVSPGWFCYQLLTEAIFLPKLFNFVSQRSI